MRSQVVLCPTVEADLDGAIGRSYVSEMSKRCPCPPCGRSTGSSGAVQPGSMATTPSAPSAEPPVGLGCLTP
ncbi:MAG: hypothetical protein AVDCRST_MAG52-1186 [uncultured Blastococcus sp.]|uniref:Uncharacterized protein n=1 Tax=uncultured Blastococcus sp. TaxID=217144 RepID=A0A6J4HT36_9ACTN|nr:MAG: hypothetical protein AVDCRST_MAG52-1186 [uncultured Blastococcus sp.]